MAGDGPTDANLIQRIREGDDEGLSALYDRYGSLCYSLSLRLTRDPHMAEDAVQSAFLSVWRGAGTYNARYGSVPTWLLTVVRNRTYDLLRKEKRWNGVVLGDLAADTPSDADPSAAAENTLLADEVRQALVQLPPAQKRVIELSFFHGYSHREIAGLLDLPLGTVKGRIRLAMEKLRTLVLEGGVDHDHATGM